MGKDSKTKQSIVLSPEARAALGKEISLFTGSLLPRDIQLRKNILQTIGPTGESPFTSAISKVSGVSQGATKTAGETRGLAPDAIAQSIMAQAERDPEFRSRILSLVDKVLGQTQAIVDPRFAASLRPETSSSTTQSPFQTALQLGGLGTGIATLLL